MKTIIKGNENVYRLLGKQPVKKSEYRLMKYVIQIKCEDGVLLQNLVTGQLVLLEKSDTQSREENEVWQACEQERLIKDFFLVSVEYNEKETVDKLRVLMRRLFTPPGIHSFTILTTTDCNARCFYCYQHNYQHVTMNADMAEKVSDFIIKQKSEGKVFINWFGGEPLIGAERIDQICGYLRQREVEYASSMISNGYLFDQGNVDKAVHLWNLKRVQITLDGTEKIYNKTKSYAMSSGSPFQKVLGNIDNLLDNGIRVNIRLNLDLHNYNDLLELTENLYARYHGCANLNVYVHVLFEDEGSLPIVRDDRTRKVLFSKQRDINANLKRCGLMKNVVTATSVITHKCVADSENAVVIFPDGHLYKCEHTNTGDAYGHVESETIDQKNVKRFQSHIEIDNCGECSLYPVCILLKECIDNQETISCTCNEKIENVHERILQDYGHVREKLQKKET